MTRHWRPGALGWACLAGLLAAVVWPAPAKADLKIGFIDSDRIFQNYSKTREAQESFNREVQEISKQSRDMKAEIDSLQRKLDQQSPMLSEAKRDEQNQLIQKKIGDYESFVQQNWGPSGRISKLNEEFLKPIVDRVHKIVSDIGTQEGYSLILDAADGNVIFGDQTLDLTDRVLVNLKAEDEGTSPPVPPPVQNTTSGGSAGPAR
jgi:outer membrane protein